MSDFVLLIIGGLIVSNLYLWLTTQRHERALSYFQDELQNRQTVATWDDLTGGED